MSDKDGKFTADKQPVRKPRGEGKRSMVIKALEARGKTEQGFWELVVDMALAGDQQMLALLSKKLFPDNKSTFEKYEISLNDGEKRLDRAEAIMNAAMTANIPIDVAERFLSSLADIAKIEEVDDITARLLKLEEMIAQ